MAVNRKKQKILYLIKLLMEKTDCEHGVTIADIIEYLEQNGIKAERKSLYDDIETLNDFGLEVLNQKRGKNCYYYVTTRRFELAELKMLVDTVQASKYISEKKTRQLIKKLEGLVSEHEGKRLHREVQIQDRIKTMNETVLYSVDAIQQAIAENKQISFQYFGWNMKKEMQLHHEGATYQVSPWALVMDQENYYLVGYDHQSEEIRHYRVDKMLRLDILEQTREGAEEFRKRNVATYTAVRFGMYDGKQEQVTMEFALNLANVVIDRFGTDLIMIPAGEDRFRVNLTIDVSPLFFGWVLGLGDGVKIIGPEHVVEEMKNRIDRLALKYKED